MTSRSTQEIAAKSSFRHGDGASRIVDARMLNKLGQTCRAFNPGETVVIRVRASFRQAVSNPVVGILIRNRIGHGCVWNEHASGAHGAGRI